MHGFNSLISHPQTHHANSHMEEAAKLASAINGSK
jgi:hypothetical protein